MTPVPNTVRRRMHQALAAACAATAALTLASCVPSGVTPAQPAFQSPTSSAGDQQLQSMVAGDSILGTNIAGEAFCTFYAQNGTSVTTTPGAPPQTGTWSVRDGNVCETKGGNSFCSRFAFQPPSFENVTITSLEGSGSFPITARVASGNNCNAMTAPVSAPAAVTGYSVSQVTFTNGGGPLGGYRSTGGGQWVETGAAGNVTFNFVETARDDWSVYLLDRGRNVEIQLDLYTRKVMYNAVGSPRQPLYDISDAR